MSKKVAIIGSGFSGLSLSYELSKNGIQSKVFERDSTIGGLAATFKVGEQSLKNSIITG